MAISVNGFIARENNEEDFLSNTNWETFIKLARQTGNFIYGRKTYDNVMTWGERYLQDMLSIKRKIIISKEKTGKTENGFAFIASPHEAIKLLEKEGYKRVLLCGGSTNNSAFAKEGLIDEVILNVEPFILGKGIPLFKQEDFEMKLVLQEIKQILNGIFQIHYKVIHVPPKVQLIHYNK